ncbi:unnamed protein product [Dimorphilus gyrociliatus]|uniref:Uncharacterized protein n=1 Tax=Dimorphilus gyrociliatus TaxID=2664684 RepID=A0A7I8VRG3_9ANNE|nr:unnamed protein product [Dimorphilus gyrociliatus]
MTADNVTKSTGFRLTENDDSIPQVIDQVHVSNCDKQLEIESCLQTKKDDLKTAKGRNWRVFNLKLWRFKYMFLLWSSVIGLSLCNILLLCSLMEFEKLFHTTRDDIPYLLILRAIGAFFGGYVINKYLQIGNTKLNEKIFVTALLVLAICTILLPQLSNINHAVLIIFFQGSALSMASSICLAFHIHLWREFSFRYLQLIQILYCISAAVGIQLIRPLLGESAWVVNKASKPVEPKTIVVTTTSTTEINGTNETIMEYRYISAISVTHGMVSVYIICVVIIGTLLYFIGSKKFSKLLDKPKFKSISLADNTIHGKTLKVLSTAFVFFLCGKEIGHTCLIVPYLVGEKGWDLSDSLYLLSTVYGLYGLTRLLFSFTLTENNLPRRLITSNILGMTFSVLPIILQYSRLSIWLSFTGNAVLIATAYHKVNTWIGRYVQMDEKAVRIISLAYDMGVIFWPLLITTAYRKIHSHWFFTANCLLSLSLLIVILLMYAVTKCVPERFRVIKPPTKVDYYFCNGWWSTYVQPDMVIAHQSLINTSNVSGFCAAADLFLSILPLANGVWFVKDEFKGLLPVVDGLESDVTNVSKPEVMRVKKRSPMPCKSAIIQTESIIQEQV